MFNLPCFGENHIDSSSIESIGLLGTIHRRRWKWNPFDNALDMVQISATRWQISHPVNGPQLPEVNGIYTIRLVINHSPKRYLKTTISDKSNGVWDLIELTGLYQQRNLYYETICHH